jgi:hypothetical protein
MQIEGISGELEASNLLSYKAFRTMPMSQKMIEIGNKSQRKSSMLKSKAIF